MAKIILVNDIGDPYEAGYTIAVCTSLEKTKELFPNGVWNLDPNGDKDRYNRPITYENLITGERRNSDNIGCPPTPYIEEVELDTKFYI